MRGGDLEAENRELRNRTKQLEQENEILRVRYYRGADGDQRCGGSPGG